MWYATLSVSGGLDGTMGGPHAFPPETKWKFSQNRPFVADSYETTYNTNRRSIYLMQQRIKKQPLLEIFDGAGHHGLPRDPQHHQPTGRGLQAGQPGLAAVRRANANRLLR